MTISADKKIVIRLPKFTWSSFFNFKMGILFLSLCTATLFSYWYFGVRPYLWISSAHVEALSSTVTSNIEGKLAEIKYSEGDWVPRGEVLFTLENPLVLSQQKQIRSSLDSLREIMQNEKARMEKAMQEYLASTANLGFEISSTDILDRHLIEYQESQLKSEEAATKIGELTREFSLLNEPMSKVVAPFDSIILKKLKSSNEMASVGDPVCSLLDVNQIWIEAEVPEKDLHLISIGTLANVQLVAYPEKEWMGKIAWISPATVSKISSLPHSQNEYISIKISLENPDALLKPGLSARVALKVH